MSNKVSNVLLSTLLLATITSCNLSNANNSDSLSEENNNSIIQENGAIRGKILADNGEVIIAGIIVEDENGNTYRTTTNALGAYNIYLMPGTYKITFTKGYEYETVTKSVTVESLKKLYLQDVRLKQLSDAYSKGWIAGDLHQHTYYSDGVDSVQNLLLSNISQGLYYGFLSDHNVARGMAEWYNAKNIPVFTNSEGESRYFSPFEAVEETTEFGHYQSLGVPLTFEKYDLELYASERNSTQKDEIIKNRISYIAESIKRAGGIAQINHPYSVSTMGFNYWELADSFDTIEIWNGVFAPCDGRYEKDGQNYLSKIKWFELLNEGKYLAATGGTDNHDTSSPGTVNGISFDKVNSYQTYYEFYNNNGKYSGMPTTYLNAQSNKKEDVLSAIKNGNSFISNGPVVLCDIDSHSYGETIYLSGNSISLNCDIFNRDGINSISVIKNGKLAKEINLNNIQKYDSNIEIDNVNSGDWIVIEVSGPECQYAITNPIFLH